MISPKKVPFEAKIVGVNIMKLVEENNNAIHWNTQHCY